MEKRWLIFEEDEQLNEEMLVSVSSIFFFHLLPCQK